MKNYKSFPKQYIGSSDISALVLVGFQDGVGATAKLLEFGKDRSYSAYICEGEEVEIGSHYDLAAEFNIWAKIYDDEKLVRNFRGRHIRIYRAGQEGCIINVFD